MKTVAIACNTMKDEIMLVISEIGTNFPIIWIDSGQHGTPEKLGKNIQRQIDKVCDVENILLLFGGCGNALLGLRSIVARLIFPRVEDCIALFLGGNQKRRELDIKGHGYYLTKGYLENEANIWTEYKYSLNKYGEEKAGKLMGSILRNYQKLRVIETGAYNLEETTAKTKTIATKLGLDHEVITGSLHILIKAFREEWDEDFVILNPGETVEYCHLGVV